MIERFVDKVVIVTGASSGIGAETARQFAAEGARVVLVARRNEMLDDVARSIGSDQASVVQADVTDPAAVAALLERAEERFGAIHVLVNNAGAHARGWFEDRSVQEVANMVDVNLRAPVVLCRTALPYLRKAGRAAIVNVGSTGGLLPVAGAATYNATKAGLRIFSLALAEELRGAGVTVSVVLPGPVATDFFLGQIEKVPPMVFCQPMSSPQAVARLVLDCAYDGRVERVIPKGGALIPTLGYVFPRFRRMMAPLFARMGARKKQRYLRSVATQRIA
ncbi:MAG: SDR family NAD(P)-dependent oxidoreductase [Phycisphaerales bacterium]